MVTVDEIKHSTYTYDTYPVVFSSACYTGSFHDMTDCLGEVFLTTPNKGAVAFWGASKGTGWPGLVTLMFSSIFEDYEYILGKIINAAFMTMDYSEVPAHLLEWNLLGDPALDISLSTGYPSRSDVAVRQSNIAVEAQGPGDLLVSATIDNIGHSNATNVTVRCSIVNSYGITETTESQMLSLLAPGEQQLISECFAFTPVDNDGTQVQFYWVETSQESPYENYVDVTCQVGEVTITDSSTFEVAKPTFVNNGTSYGTIGVYGDYLKSGDPASYNGIESSVTVAKPSVVSTGSITFIQVV